MGNLTQRKGKQTWVKSSKRLEGLTATHHFILLSLLKSFCVNISWLELHDFCILLSQRNLGASIPHDILSRIPKDFLVSDLVNVTTSPERWDNSLKWMSYAVSEKRGLEKGSEVQAGCMSPIFQNWDQ